MKLELDDEEAGFIFGFLKARLDNPKITKAQKFVGDSILDAIRQAWVKEHGPDMAARLERTIESFSKAMTDA
jgi:hypothetical protein